MAGYVGTYGSELGCPLLLRRCAALRPIWVSTASTMGPLRRLTGIRCSMQQVQGAETLQVVPSNFSTGAFLTRTSRCE
jgi:hypothetical protein